MVIELFGQLPTRVDATEKKEIQIFSRVINVPLLKSLPEAAAVELLGCLQSLIRLPVVQSAAVDKRRLGFGALVQHQHGRVPPA